MSLALQPVLAANFSLACAMRISVGKEGQVEIQHSIGFTLHMNRAIWDASDAVAPETDASDAVAPETDAGADELAETRGTIRNKTRENVALFVAALTGPAISAPRAVLARAGVRDLGYLVRRLDPTSAAAMSSALRLAAEAPADPERAAAAKVVLASLATTPPADLVISETDVRDARGTVLVPLPADRTGGVDAAFKRSGATDLYVKPVAASLASLAESRRPHMLVVEAASSTPYRLLVEMLFTAGQNEWRGFDLRVLGQPTHHVITYAPRAVRRQGTDAQLGRLAVFVANDGVSVKWSGGNLAAGCERTGPGLAIRTREGAYDLTELMRCLGKLKATFPTERSAVVAANPGVAFGSILPVVGAVRGPHLELFEEVTWGVAR